MNSRIIRENVRYVDGFITLNESIADFYREKYPELPEAVLVPNAVERVAQTRYDGRLHKAAGLHLDQKILLFQGVTRRIVVSRRCLRPRSICVRTGR